MSYFVGNPKDKLNLYANSRKSSIKDLETKLQTKKVQFAQ